MLRRYRCHKIVEAGEIKQITEEPGNEEPVAHHAVLQDGSRFGGANIFGCDKKPSAGDFIVVYENGHVSWSPRKPFLDGYSPIDHSGADYQPAQEHP
jgi:hypothetical protein